MAASNRCAWITYEEDTNKPKTAQLCGRQALYMVQGNSYCETHVKRPGDFYLKSYTWIDSEVKMEYDYEYKRTHGLGNPERR